MIYTVIPYDYSLLFLILKTQKHSSTIFSIPITITHDNSHAHADTAFLDTGAMRSVLKLSLFNKFRNFLKYT